ncbi:MAG TPA: glucoamylase family protein [Gillisia sp.]|nr:glucoamylase family protein [Gillisia sp.]
MKAKGIIILLFLFSTAMQAQEPEYHHVFFENSLMENSWFYSDTSYEGPSFILNVQGRLPVENTLSFTPGNSLQLSYTSHPEGDWKAKLDFPQWRGKDFIKTGDYLSLWIYVTGETQKDQLPQLTIAYDDDNVREYLSLGNYLDSYKPETWLQVKIPLDDFKGSGGKQPSEIDSRKILQVLLKQPAQGEGDHKIFIDQVEIYKEEASKTNLANPEITNAKGYERHVDLTWENVDPELVRYIKIYRSEGNKDFSPVGVQSPQEYSRYTDYTGVPDKTYHYKISVLGNDYSESSLSSSVSVQTREMNDEELMEMVQEAAFRYYWEGAEPTSGLARENIPGRKNMIATGASGFGLMALIVGAEREFISREEFISRISKIVSFIENGDTFHGALSHFMDGPTGKAEPFFGKYDDGADLVETSFFMQGLLTVEQYLSETNPEEKELRNRISQIWKNVEWEWFKQFEDSPYLYWHWSPEHEWHINHKLIGWNETLITYFLAIASPTHPISPEMYYTGWAGQDTIAQNYRSNWGRTLEGANFTNNETYYGIPLEVGVGNGGPLFFIHYSFLGLDPRKFEDKYTNYFENNRDIALINYRYSSQNPEKYEGYSPQSWGLTASDGPWGYKAREPKPEMDDGTMAPTGAIASFPYTPEESLAALKHFYRENGSFLWGEYGFRDAFNLSQDWTANIFMGLNQAPMVVMIENHRTGLLWDLFMKNPDVQKAIEKLNQTKP